MHPRLIVFGLSLFMLGLGSGLLIDDIAVARADSNHTKPALMVVMGRNYDREALKAYAKVLPPIYEKYQGEYLAVQREFTQLEGNYPYESIVVSRWPNLAAAKAFWASPEYAGAKKIREGNGEFDVIAFEAFPGAVRETPMLKE